MISLVCKRYHIGGGAWSVGGGDTVEVRNCSRSCDLRSSQRNSTGSAGCYRTLHYFIIIFHGMVNSSCTVDTAWSLRARWCLCRPAQCWALSAAHCSGFVDLLGAGSLPLSCLSTRTLSCRPRVDIHMHTVHVLFLSELSHHGSAYCDSHRP